MKHIDKLAIPRDNNYNINIADLSNKTCVKYNIELTEPHTILLNINEAALIMKYCDVKTKVSILSNLTKTDTTLYVLLTMIVLN